LIFSLNRSLQKLAFFDHPENEMKAILKFDLPEETTEFHSAINGGDALAALSEFDEYLRSFIKYPPDDTPKQALDAYQAIRDELHRLLGMHDVTLF